MKIIYNCILFYLMLNTTALGQKISLIKNINNSPEASINFFYYSGAFLNEKSFIFSANDDINGRELWITDGTESGTQLLKDIYPGEFTPDIFNLTKVKNNKVVFQANDGIHGSEIWVSDGTSSGTVLLKDINVGNSGSGLNYFTPFMNKLFFLVSDFGEEDLWETDGTPGGTKVFIDYPNNNNTHLASFFPIESGFIFEVYDSKTDKQGLYFSDGTKAGTRFIVDLNPVAGYNGRLEISDFAKLANNRYVFACRTSGTSEVPTLYSTDLTASGTIQLATMNYSGTGTITLSPFTVINDKAVFINSNAGKGNEKVELWTTDGTISGTVLLLKGYSINLNSYIDVNLRPIVSDKLFFTKDLQYTDGGTFSTDGTAANTKFEFKLPNGFNYDLIYYSNKLLALGGTAFAGKIYEIDPFTKSSIIFYDEDVDSVKCGDFSEPTLINNRIIMAGSFFAGTQFDKELFRMNIIPTSAFESERENPMLYKVQYMKDQIIINGFDKPELYGFNLYNMYGQQLISLKGNSFSINKNCYPKGIYLATITNHQRKSIAKLIIN